MGGIRVASGDVVACALHVQHERGERRGRIRVDDAEPAADHVLCRERGAIGELQAGPEMEDDAPAVRRDLPACRQRRLERQRGVVDGQGLVELRDDRGGGHVAGSRGIVGSGLPGADPDLVRVDGGDPGGFARERQPGDERQRGGKAREQSTAGSLAHAPSMEEGPASHRRGNDARCGASQEITQNDLRR